MRPRRVIRIDSVTGEILHHTDLKYDGLFPGNDSSSPCDMDLDVTPEGEYVVSISNTENTGSINEMYIISPRSKKVIAHVAGGKAYNPNQNTMIVEDNKGNLCLAKKYHLNEIVQIGQNTLDNYYMKHR